MRKLMNKKSGFTLIELMIVVAILGILAAVAIPAFVTYVRRSKTVEATENLSKMFDAVATYYNKEFAGTLINDPMQAHCVVPTVDDGKADPGDQKVQGTYTANAFDTNANGIGFFVGPAYYAYSITRSATALCQNTTTTAANAYSLVATGDLDADNLNSTFTYLVGANAENELYHAPAFRIVNETE